MDAERRRLVRDRAQDRCEYCRLPQSAAPFLRFHLEHIRAQQHIADDSPENLALACPDCNRHKGPNLTTLEPGTGKVVALFNPRTDAWGEHFELEGAFLAGKTDVGRATIRLLQMNAEERVEMRAELLASGEM